MLNKLKLYAVTILVGISAVALSAHADENKIP